jgi:putative membrane protein
MAGFILRALIASLGLWAATEILDGLTIDDATTLILAGVLLGLVNAVVRPFALLLSLPALLFTLGLFLLVVNAAMLGLVALMLHGFHIDGFWTAIGGSLIVSVVSWVGSWFIGPKGRVEIIRHREK